MSGNNQNNYFDLITTGFGYINRARLVKPKKGDPFYAMTIAALRGDEGETTYIDCKVVGTEAIKLCEAQNIEQFDFSAKGTDKGTITFSIGDLYLDEFTYSSDHRDASKAGTKGVNLKGRLLKIKYLKINDVVIVTSANAESAEPQQAA